MPPDDTLSTSAARVQAALRARGLPCRVIHLSQSSRTAEEAARAIGCEVGQIVKSLVFRTKSSRRPVLVLASGSNRVDPKKLRYLVGEKIGKADAAFVREHAGYAIGGVPPLGHPEPLETIVDRDLLTFGTVWAAAGTPYSVFALAPGVIGKLGQVADVKA